MAVTAVSIVNRALQEIGSQSTITSFNDGTPEAIAAGVLYEGILESVLRQAPWDAVRKEASLSVTPNTAPKPWTIEYYYPSDGIQIRQIAPPTISQFDPQAIRWAVGSVSVSGTPTKVIWTDQANAVCVYTAAVSESEYDSLLVEAIVRSLASAMAMSIPGRPDFAKEKLEEASMITQIAESRDY